ncbi:MAG: hypothetical protein KAJ86_07350 [Alphaproteobacteria bacterium]|nr:hypothetical protein [Alphaproteobacteria bacterium]
MPFTVDKTYGKRSETWDNCVDIDAWQFVSGDLTENTTNLVHEACADKEAAKVLILEAELYGLILPECVWQDKELCHMIVEKQGIDAIPYVPHKFFKGGLDVRFFYHLFIHRPSLKLR